MSKEKRMTVVLNENKDSSWHDELCLIADKYGGSNRLVTEAVGAVYKAGGVEVKNTKLSVSTIRRNRMKLRKKTANTEMIHQECAPCDGLRHWLRTKTCEEDG